MIKYNQIQFTCLDQMTAMGADLASGGSQQILTCPDTSIPYGAMIVRLHEQQEIQGSNPHQGAMVACLNEKQEIQGPNPGQGQKCSLEMIM